MFPSQDCSTAAPARTANDAAVCRRSWGVIVGNSGVVAARLRVSRVLRGLMRV